MFPAPAFIDFPPGQERIRRGDLGEDRGRLERGHRGAGVGAGAGGYVPLYRQAALPPEEEMKPRMERLVLTNQK